MSDTKSPPRIWTITDTGAGNLRQAKALADAMGGAEDHLCVDFPVPWRWLAPRGVPFVLDVLGTIARQKLQTPWPDIFIGCGRQAALALRAIKHRDPSRVFTVQILSPRIATTHFDLVITPQHDRLQAANLIPTIGALNVINDTWVKQARQQFSSFSSLPRPLITVLIGGPHRNAQLDEDSLKLLFERVSKLRAREGGTLLLAASRRTPEAWWPYLRTMAHNLNGQCWLDKHDGENPYPGYLAFADRVIVTADSVNMLSEACALGVSVISYCAYPLSGKLALFDASLRNQQMLAEWNEAPRQHSPLRETESVAQIVLRHWHGSHC